MSFTRHWTANEDELLRQQYARFNAAELAALLSRSEIAVRKRAAKLGLTIVGDPAAPRVRVAAHQRFAREHGWPEDLPIRCVQLLDLIYRDGPQSRRQLAEHLGMSWPSFYSSGYISLLLRRGLLVNLGKLAKGRGRGRSASLYGIPPHIRRSVA